jgi:hypothetical protein
LRYGKAMFPNPTRTIPRFLALIFLFPATSLRANDLVYPVADAIRLTYDSSARVIAIADVDHRNAYIRKNIAHVLTIYKGIDRTFDCLYLEIDRRMQPALDRYEQAAAPDFSRIVSALFKIRPGLKALGLGLNSEIDILNEDLLSRARTLGFSIRAGDIDFSSPQGRQARNILIDNAMSTVTKHDAATGLQERSRNFADLVASDADNNVCHRSIVVFGSAHFLDRFLDFPVLSFPHYLEHSGITFLLAYTEPLNCMADKNEGMQELCRRVEAGEQVAIVTDAGRASGTPPLIFLSK